MTPLRLLIDETAAAAIEFALLGMQLAVAIAGAVALVGTQLSDLYRTGCSAASAVSGGDAC